ncbi:hypothetical protein ACIP4W_26240 [Streptomyces sp. NPDC088846]|uniref:hypothetical protein n=1 Tax=Streptomyces sp. NPDC088846 TaxID=3365908 RepID=UPI0037FA4589
MGSVPALKPVPRPARGRDAEPDTAPGAVAPVGHVIEFADGPGGDSRVVAHVERELPPGGIPAYLEARGSGDAARGPRRIVWRAGQEVPLEFRSDDDEIHVHAAWVDWRLAAALSALIRTFDSRMGTPWDDKRR